MDLDQLSTASADTGVKMSLRHPSTDDALLQDDGKTPITITLLGSDSKVHKAATAEVINRRLARQASRGGRVPTTSEGLDADGLTVIVACTVAWDGVRVAGQPQECTPATVRELYGRFPWMREQAEAFIGDRRNFLPPAASAAAA